MKVTILTFKEMFMEKAYDLKDLGKRLEKAGVPLLKNSAEETAKVVYHETKEWMKESAVLSTNKIDDLVAPFYDQADALVMPQIDKIDGEVG